MPKAVPSDFTLVSPDSGQPTTIDSGARPSAESVRTAIFALIPRTLDIVPLPSELLREILQQYHSTDSLQAEKLGRVSNRDLDTGRP
jgi:hypothetical protein